MIFKQFYLPSLGHASYLLGDEATGAALVLDPRRDVDCYLDAARSEGLRVSYGLDTHGHNDYLSGLSELSARSELQLLGLADAHLGYHHRPVSDGEIIELGDIAVEIVHTPGHTPEHISLVVYDLSVGDEAALLLSGGALLVGDVARPDLLGNEEQTRRAAATFHCTLQTKILTLPDHVEVFPTHVAGSLCGGNISSRLSTTIGYERKTNPVLAQLSASDEFIDAGARLNNLPAVPPYWRRMRAQNLDGPRRLGVLPEPPALRPHEFAQAQEAGAVVLDTRQPEAFGGAHIPAALNAGLGGSFATWAGTVLPDDAQVLLVLDDPDDLWEASWQLLRIGFDLPIGWLAGGMFAWRTSALPLEALPQITAEELRQRWEADEVEVLDVRQPAEWANGHIDGATFITGAELPQRVDEVPAGKPLAVICGSGYRSSVSASLLAARGIRPVCSVLGGMSAWDTAGYPTTQ